MTENMSVLRTKTMIYNASKVYVTQWQPFALPTNGMANPDTWREWAQVRPESGDDHHQLHDGGGDDEQHVGGDDHQQLRHHHYPHHINYDNASCCR